MCFFWGLFGQFCQRSDLSIAPRKVRHQAAQPLPPMQKAGQGVAEYSDSRIPSFERKMRKLFHENFLALSAGRIHHGCFFRDRAVARGL